MILKKIKIKDIGEIVTGKTPPTKSKEYYGNDFVFIKPTYIDMNNRYFENVVEKVSNEAFEKYKSSFVPANSTCVVTIGSIGEKICLTKEVSLTNQAINSIIPYKDKYDNIFIYYLLKYNLYKVKAMNNGTSSGRENVSKTAFENIEVEVPDILKQRRIAKILSSYDDLIENNLKRIKLLEESADLIYKEWFVNFTFPGYEKCEFVDGKPKGWNTLKVKKFGNVITGKTPSTKKTEYYGNEVPFIKTPDMNDSIYVVKTNQMLSEAGAKSQEKKFIPKDAILVSCIGTLGVVALAKELSQFNQQINAIVCNKKEYIHYLYFKFKSLKEYLEALGSNGATMGNVNKNKFENIEILKPDDKLLEKYNCFSEPIFKEILNLQLSNEKLKEARDILIPKLVMGEIEV